MGAGDGVGLIAAGREALRAADWERARVLFEQAPESAEALDGLSEVARYQCEYERSIELGQRAFVAYRRDGNPVGAANVAFWLAFTEATYHGNYTAAGAWISRAESVLEGVQECSAHGRLVLYRAPFSDDISERENCAAAALAVARRFGDTDLEYEALALLGESRVAAGRVAEGLRLLDESMAAVSAGEIADHGAIGEIYCRLLSGCELAVDVRRAEEWMAHVDRRVAWTDFVRPTCRAHYGGILIALGRWEEAETEIRAAIDGFERGWRGDKVLAVVRLANLRVHQGRYEEAERLLDGVEWHPMARRAAAAIALARGELALADDLARLCFEGTDPADPGCAPLLALLVSIQIARDDLVSAKESLSKLDTLAGASRDERAAAFASLAAGRVQAAANDERAASSVKQAVEQFAALQLPLEAARAQLELARTVAATAPQAAIAEARLALTAFGKLGAARDADAAAAVLRELGATGRAWPRGHSALTKREAEVVSLLAAGLANAQIAERLVISRRTAEHHVASVLSKLGLKSRAEAAAYAVREGLERQVGE